MSKIERPSLFQLALAQSYGFHTARFMHRDLHYARVVIETSKSTVLIDAFPFEYIGQARPYKADRNAPKWYIAQWWEDELFMRELRTSILEHGTSLDKPCSFRLNAENQLFGKVR